VSFAAVLLFVPSIAIAESSPLAIGQKLKLGFDVARAEGKRPSFVPGDREYDQMGYWLHLRTAVSSETGDDPLGTQLGFEYAVALGITPKESGEPSDRAPIGAFTSLALALRAFTFDLPIEGMVAFRLGGQIGAGGAHWWSDSPWFGFIVGSRVGLFFGGEIRAELDYEIMPHAFGSSPGEIEVRHLEHRFGLSLGAGEFGVAAHGTIGDDRSRSPIGDRASTSSRTLTFSIEWRS
jgi:hypothetical protein